MPRRIAILTALVLILAAAAPALVPAEVAPFDAKAFADAQAAGQSVVVAVNATW